MEHFFRAMKYSRDGFRVLLRERAFCQELGLICALLSASAFAGGARCALDVLPWGILVLVTEALNTAVERTVDLCTSEWKPLAKMAKDCASFACAGAITAFLAAFARAVFF